MICYVGVYSREIINILSSVKCLGLLKKLLHSGIFSHTVNVINVKLCIMVLLIALHVYSPLSVTLTVFQVRSNVEQF